MPLVWEEKPWNLEDEDEEEEEGVVIQCLEGGEVTKCGEKAAIM